LRLLGPPEDYSKDCFLKACNTGAKLVWTWPALKLFQENRNKNTFSKHKTNQKLAILGTKQNETQEHWKTKPSNQSKHLNMKNPKPLKNKKTLKPSTNNETEIC